MIKPAGKSESKDIRDFRVRTTARGKIFEKNVAPNNVVNFVLQRKASCSCGGGCPSCQAKTAHLPVSQPTDASEVEADRMADKVMRMPKSSVGSPPLSKSLNPIQTKKQDGTGVSTNNSAKIESISAGGENGLDSETKAFMQSRFAADFSGVRIHTDGEAVKMSETFKAKAFTVGSDIYFNEGQYQPHSESGKKLLAHELAHVVQQRSGFLTKIMRVPTEDGINDKPPRYSYSTNCGWIDWGHASPDLAKKLIQAVQDASDRMRASGSSTPELVKAPRMEAKAPLVGLVSGVTPIVHIKKALSKDEVLSVALRIFMLQSMGFEALQVWTDAIGSSSFSEEDLSSNLISFYMAARDFNRAKVESICDVWDSARSLTKFQGYSFTRNQDFRPLNLPSKGAFPADFSTIKPATAGGALMDSPDANFETTFFDFKDALTGSGTVFNNPLGGLFDTASGLFHIASAAGKGVAATGSMIETMLDLYNAADKTGKGAGGVVDDTEQIIKGAKDAGGAFSDFLKGLKEENF